MVKESFFATVCDLTLGAVNPPEGDEEAYQTHFGDNKESDGVVINSRSSLRMSVKKAEAAWLAIHFESKWQSDQ